MFTQSVNYSSAQLPDFIYPYDLSRHFSSVNDMTLTSDSSILITGGAWYHNGPEDYFVIKTDLEGQIKWSVFNSTSSIFGAGKIIHEISGNRYVMVKQSEYTYPFDYPIIMAFDTIGMLLWQFMPFASTDTHLVISDFLEIQNQLYFVGYFCNRPPVQFFRKGVIFKTDLNGSILQIIHLPGIIPPVTKNGILASENHIIIGGSTDDTITANILPQLTLIDTNGLVIWQHSYSTGNTNASSEDVFPTPGGYILLSTSFNLMDIIKVDSTGNFQWSARHNFVHYPRYYHLSYHENIMMCGMDCSISRFDSVGQIVFTSPSFFQGFEPVKMKFHNSKIYLAGSKYIGTGTKGYIIRLNDSLLTNLTSPEFLLEKIFPNPVRTGALLYLGNFISYAEEISLISIDGKTTVKDIELKGRSSHDLHFTVPHNIMPGIYIVSFRKGEIRYSKRIVVQ